MSDVSGICPGSSKCIHIHLVIAVYFYANFLKCGILQWSIQYTVCCIRSLFLFFFLYH
ncbi:hypothetical protein BDF14DRAFT_1782426 [Spinellus fusiger]|nr:hypothetical protein BDF14DRAFT_1782426 [Spinellus fusiger]